MKRWSALGTLLLLTGCVQDLNTPLPPDGGTNFPTDSDPADAGSLPPSDAASDSPSFDSSPPICPPFSCKIECGGADRCSKDAGLLCGTAGPFICGTQSCGMWAASNPAYTCDPDGGQPHLFACADIDSGGPDIMPHCSYQGAANYQRWYCCDAW